VSTECYTDIQMMTNRKAVVITVLLITAVVIATTTVVFIQRSSSKCDDPGARIGTCEFTKPLGGNVRLSVCNRSIIDIRQFVRTGDQIYRSTIKGINLNVKQWNEIIKLASWVQCHLYK
jgi:hypothetical protein